MEKGFKKSALKNFMLTKTVDKEVEDTFLDLCKSKPPAAR